jgi:hypothetical protein
MTPAIRSWAALAALSALPGCVSPPWQAPPGGVIFKAKPDCSFEYENTGRDIDNVTANFTCPNGTKGELHVTGSRGSSNAASGQAAQAQLNAVLIGMLGSKIPNLGAILAASGVPVPPAQ